MMLWHFQLLSAYLLLNRIFHQYFLEVKSQLSTDDLAASFHWPFSQHFRHACSLSSRQQPQHWLRGGAA
jgi:hypothetical protein